jgi:hypothetical protein
VKDRRGRWERKRVGGEGKGQEGKKGKVKVRRQTG